MDRKVEQERRLVITSGQCLCGGVSFEAVGDPKWVGHCHCPSCRKATSAAFASYAGFDASQVQLKGDSLADFASSPGIKRRFCNHCGSPVSFEGETWPGEIHLHVGLFDQPEALSPIGHAFVKTRMPWIKLCDGLPERYEFKP